jgi:hypothetical protein
MFQTILLGKGGSLFEMTLLLEVKSRLIVEIETLFHKSLRKFEIKSTKLKELQFKQTHQQLDL